MTLHVLQLEYPCHGLSGVPSQCEFILNVLACLRGREAECGASTILVIHTKQYITPLNNT
jgi:hypothetical protein